MARLVVLMFSMLSLIGCSRPTAEHLREQVDNGELKATPSQPNETIRISFVNVWEEPSRHLDVVLHPGGTLSLKGYRMGWPDGLPEPRILTDNEERLRLSGKQLADLRTRLSVFRPERLERDGPFVLPRDCHFISDGSIRAVVEFSDNSKGGGYFILQEGCNQPSGKQLEVELRRILESLPQAKTLTAFEWAPSRRNS